MDADRIASIFSNEHEMRRVVEDIHRMTDAIASMASALDRGAAQAATGIDGVAKAAAGVNSEIDKAQKKTEEMTANLDLNFSKLQKTLQSVEGIMKSIGSHAGAVFQGMNSLQSNPQNMIMNKISAIPVYGPLIEMMIESQQRQDILRTAGRNAVLQFGSRQTLNPEDVKRMGVEVGAEMQRLEENFLGTRDEVMAVFGAISEGGGKVADALKPASIQIKGFEDSLVGTSLGLDKSFRQSAGTTATLASALSKDMGTSLEKSLMLVKDLGQAAQGTSLNFQQFVGTILQVTSALRTQGGDAEDLAKAYFNIRGAFQSSLGPGVDSRHLDALTGQALQGIPGAVTGISEGMQAVIAQKMAGGRLSDIGALRAYQTGFQFSGVPGMQGPDGRRHFEQQAIEQIYNQGAQNTRNSDELFLFLTKIGHMPAELAEAMIQTQGNLFQGDAYKEKRKEYEKAAQQAADLQPLTIGTFEKVMKEIQNLMFAVSQLIVAALGTLITVSGNGFKMIAAAVHGDFAEVKELKKQNQDAFDNMYKKGDAVKDRLKQLGSNVDISGVVDMFTDPEKGNGKSVQDVMNEAHQRFVESKQQIREAGGVKGSDPMDPTEMSYEDKRTIMDKYGTKYDVQFTIVPKERGEAEGAFFANR